MDTETRVRQWKRVNNFVAFPLFVIGAVPGVLVLDLVHRWFLGVAAVGALISGLANVMVLRLRKAEQTGH